MDTLEREKEIDLLERECSRLKKVTNIGCLMVTGAFLKWSGIIILSTKAY